MPDNDFDFSKYKDEEEDFDFEKFKDNDLDLNKFKDVAPDDDIGPVKAGALGLAQGYASDFLDEGYGAVKKVFGGDYSKSRNELRDLLARAEKKYPKIYGGSNLFGNIVSPVNKLSMVTGGALAGLGSSESDLTKGEYMGNLASAIGGGAAGKLFQQIGKRLSPDNLKQSSSAALVKAATGNNRKTLRQLEGADPFYKDSNRIKIADALREEIPSVKLNKKIPEDSDLRKPTIRFGDDAGDINEKALRNFRYLKDQYEATSKALDATGFKVKGNHINKFLDTNLKNYLNTGVELSDQTSAKNVLEEIKSALSGREITFEQAQNLKNQYKYTPLDGNPLRGDKNLNNGFYNAIADAMEITADRVAKTSIDPKIQELAENFKTLKTDYGKFKNIVDAASEQESRNLKNSRIGLLGTIAGVGGAASHLANQGVDVTATNVAVSAGVGLALSGLVKLAQNRGNSAYGVAARGLANMLSKSPSKYAKYSDKILKSLGSDLSALPVLYQVLRSEEDSSSNSFESPVDYSNLNLE